MASEISHWNNALFGSTCCKLLPVNFFIVTHIFLFGYISDRTISVDVLLLVYLSPSVSISLLSSTKRPEELHLMVSSEIHSEFLPRNELQTVYVSHFEYLRTASNAS